VINNSLLKCVRSFGKSKEKIVNIQGDSFHNKVMDVVKVVAEQKNKKAPPSLLGSKMVNPNLGRNHLIHSYQKRWLYNGDMCLFLMGSLPN